MQPHPMYDLHMLQRIEKYSRVGSKNNKSPPKIKKVAVLSPYLTEVSKQEELQKRKFYKAVQESDRVLFRIQAVFPFDFFPDTLTIDPLKVNYTHEIFFYSSFTESIPIADITNVVVEESVIFATLRISFISYPTRQIYIKPIWKSDAEKAREILAGLMVVNREKIEMEKVQIYNSEDVARLGHMD